MKKIKWSLLVLVAVVMIFATACGGKNASGGGSGSSSKSAGTITVGSKNFTENIILAYMMADLIEAKTNVKVIRKVNLGGSNVAWKALKSNDIQLYPDYTGTIVANYYQKKPGNAEQTLSDAKQLVQKDNLQLLKPFGFNNTYTLAVTQDTAKKYNLNSFSDLAKVSNQLILGCEFEFLDRPDGLPGLKKVYGFNFKKAKGMDHGIMYRAVANGEVDVIDSYSTDGQLKVKNLKILKDDKNFFPPYDAVPVIRQDTLKKYPKIQDALNQLSGKINAQTMQSLNAKVDSQGLKAEDVAHQFLVNQGLIKK